MIRIRYVWMRNKSPETCNFTRQRDGQGEKIYHFCFISDVVMTRSPLFSPNLFYWPTLLSTLYSTLLCGIIEKKLEKKPILLFSDVFISAAVVGS